MPKNSWQGKIGAVFACGRVWPFYGIAIDSPFGKVCYPDAVWHGSVARNCVRETKAFTR
jgi:hypothetical protein